MEDAVKVLLGDDPDFTARLRDDVGLALLVLKQRDLAEELAADQLGDLDLPASGVDFGYLRNAFADEVDLVGLDGLG